MSSESGACGSLNKATSFPRMVIIALSMCVSKTNKTEWVL